MTFIFMIININIFEKRPCFLWNICIICQSPEINLRQALFTDKMKLIYNWLDNRFTHHWYPHYLSQKSWQPYQNQCFLLYFLYLKYNKMLYYNILCFKSLKVSHVTIIKYKNTLSQKVKCWVRLQCFKRLI